MIRRFLQLFLLMAASCGLLSAQQVQKPLSNQDVIDMVKAALPTSTILGAIQANPTAFDVSAAGLIKLKKAGVTQRVMDAMLTASKQGGAAAQETTMPAATPRTSDPSAATQPAWPYGQMPTGTTTSSAPGGMGVAGNPSSFPPSGAAPVVGQASVAFVQGGARQEIPPDRTQLAETKNKPTSMTSLAADSTLGQALQGGVSSLVTQAAMHTSSAAANTSLNEAQTIFSSVLSHRKPTVTYVWALSGPNSATTTATNLPTLAVDFSTVMGVKPDEFEPAIVKLTPAQGTYRIVAATQGKEDAKSNSSVDWQMYSGFLEDRVTVQGQRQGPGKYQITPMNPLWPGEYAVVLRPVSKSKKFSGGDVARSQGDGFLFDSAWSFQVIAQAR
jgi:hypothetical protein